MSLNFFASFMDHMSANPLASTDTVLWGNQRIMAFNDEKRQLQFGFLRDPAPHEKFRLNFRETSIYLESLRFQIQSFFDRPEPCLSGAPKVIPDVHRGNTYRGFAFNDPAKFSEKFPLDPRFVMLYESLVEARTQMALDVFGHSD